MDYWKFENLIQKKSLYLCRADNLQDRFEGTYSHQQIKNMNEWLALRGYNNIVESERDFCQRIKKRFFISCWNISDHDLDLMWKAYTKDKTAVAIQSTVEKLENIADAAVPYWPIDVSVVDYIHHAEGEHIDYLDGFDAIISKDFHFELDREIRIIHWPNYQKPIPQEVFLPVDLNVLIEKIVLHPQVHSSPMDTIENLLHTSGIKDVAVETSRDYRPFTE